MLDLSMSKRRRLHPRQRDPGRHECRADLMVRIQRQERRHLAGAPHSVFFASSERGGGPPGVTEAKVSVILSEVGWVGVKRRIKSGAEIDGLERPLPHRDPR